MTRPVSSAAVLGLLVLLWTTSLWAAPPAATPVVEAAVRESVGPASAKRSVRVIVKLTTPGIVSEAHLGHDSFAVAQQRSRIADHQDAALSGLARTNHRVLWRYRTSPFLAVDASPEALRALEASPFVESIVPDLELEPLLHATGPLVQADISHAAGITGAGQVVVIIDSGLDTSHPFVSDRIVDEWCFVSSSGCSNGLSIQSGVGAAAPVSSHGTHVAGIAAGAGVTFSGVAPQSGIIPIRVFPSTGGASVADVKAALDRVTLLKNTWPIAAVNMSLGSSLVYSSSCDFVDAPYGLKADIDTLRSSGIATVVATGNDGLAQGVRYPGCLSNTIKVGASTNTDAIASYSNRAPNLEGSTLFAPGGDAEAANVCSSFPPSYTSPLGACSNPGTSGAYWFMTGTSMATPHVAGAWALLKQVKPNATVDEVLQALRATAVPIWDPTTGATYKRIHIRDAVGALTNLSVTLGASVPPPQQAQTTVTFTAAATGGVAPLQYKWRIFDGSAWSVARDWSPQSTFDWTPPTANSSYRVGVWAKSGTITRDAVDRVEASASMAFPIVTSTLTLVSLTSDVTPPQTPGTTITFTATGTSGLPPYRYKWWVFDGTAWKVTQDWSTDHVYRWTPAIPSPSYRVGVWIKSAHNASDTYDRPESTGSVPFQVSLVTTRLESLSSNKSSPQAVGASVTFTATATGGNPPLQYKWWVFDGVNWAVAPGGAWTTGNTYTWTPAVANANYRVGVWIRSHGVTADVFDRPEATASVAFAIDPSDLTLTSLNPDAEAPQLVGTPIAFQATATGGVQPYRYKWWVFDGVAWTMAQDWSLADTFRWVPTTARSTYRVGVWVKSATTSGDVYDRSQSTGSVAFPIKAPDLTLTGITADKPAPQPAWTVVTFTAAAAGGAGPLQYKWWVFDGTNWTVVRDWSPANTFSWTPTAPNGSSRVGVWVKSAVTPGDTYDRPESTGSIAYVVNPGSLTLTSLAANAVSPRPLGSTVTFTATGTGGVAPYQYKWWVFDGTTWSVVQNWSTVNTFAWTPAVARSTYKVGVWMRSATNTADVFDRTEATRSVSFAINGPAQVRFLNDLCFVSGSACFPFTAQLRSQGYTWISFSGSWSPYQPVGPATGAYTLSGFVLQVLDAPGGVVFFEGSFTLSPDTKYALVATLDMATDQLRLLLLYEGLATDLSLDQPGVRVDALSATRGDDLSIELGPIRGAPAVPW